MKSAKNWGRLGMKFEMKTKALRFLSDIQTGPFGSQLHKEDYVDDGTPIVTVEHLGNRVFTEQNLPRVSNEDKQRLSKYILKEGDIVFSRVGSVDRCSFVDSQHTGWLFSGRCLWVSIIIHMIAQPEGKAQCAKRKFTDLAAVASPNRRKYFRQIAGLS